MKKLLIAAVALLLSVPALAWCCPPPPPCHGGCGWGSFWAGAAVGSLVNRACWGWGGGYRYVPYAAPVVRPVYYTAPTVYTTPVYYTTPVVTTPVVYYW